MLARSRHLLPNFQSSLVVATCFVENDKQEVLLLRRSKKEDQADTWCVPGGKADKGEAAVDTCRREVAEETALKLPSDQVRHCFTKYVRIPGWDYELQVFHAAVSGRPQVVLDPQEHSEFRWAAKAAMFDFGLIQGQREAADLLFGHLEDAPIIHIKEDFLRDALEHKGYALLRGAVDREAVGRVRKHVVDLLRQKKWATDAAGNAAAQGYKIGSPPFYDVLAAAMRLEPLHELCGAPVIKAIANQLLGCETYLHPRRMLRVGWPERVGLDNRVVAHQDHFYVQGEVDTLTVWLPLGDLAADEGGLEFLPGSHKRGLWPTQVDDAGRFSCGIIDVPANTGWDKIVYRMGDVVVFHSLTVHQAGKNMADKLRLSLDFRFSAADGAAIADELLPPYAPHVPDWLELSQGWRAPGRIEVPATLRMVPKVARPAPAVHHLFHAGTP